MTNRNTGSAKRLYELNCLVPLRENEKIIAIAKKIMDFIEKEKGEIMEAEKKDNPESSGSKSRVWLDKKKLAYPVKNERGGYYLNSWFKIEPENLAELRRFLKLEKDILRYEILTEDNISNLAPTQDSVKLDDIDSLAVRPNESSFGRVAGTRPARTEGYSDRRTVEEKIRYRERVKDIKPKEQAFAVEKEKTVAEAPKKIVTAQEKSAKVKEETEKPKLEIEQTVEPIKQETEKKPEPRIEKKLAEEKTEEPAVAKAMADERKEKLKKPKKISLEDLDKRLDDILNEEIL